MVENPGMISGVDHYPHVNPAKTAMVMVYSTALTVRQEMPSSGSTPFSASPWLEAAYTRHARHLRTRAPARFFLFEHFQKLFLINRLDP